MEKRGTDRIDDLGVAETPEDVAVLYSWANLHGAKYRDFSASRREYRAQLRHRAAEQVREQALLAQAEAEAAAEAAEAAARKASEAARVQQGAPSDSGVKKNLRQAEEAARTAAAERVEAARRAEAAATAEAAARREEREIAEAQASAQRQAARYAESEVRSRESAAHAYGAPPVPGEISDPYSPQPYNTAPAQTLPRLVAEAHRPAPPPVNPSAPPVQHLAQQPSPQPPAPPLQAPYATPAPAVRAADNASRSESISSQRRRQGYHPDEASGVREIYRGPEYTAPPVERRATESGRFAAPMQPRAEGPQPPRERRSAPEQPSQQNPESQPGTSGRSASPATGSGSGSSGGRQPFQPGQEKPRIEPTPVEPPKPNVSVRSSAPATPPPSRPRESAPIAPFWENPRAAAPRTTPYGTGYIAAPEPIPGSAVSGFIQHSQVIRPAAEASSTPRAVSPFSQPPAPADAARGRRAQDDTRQPRSTGFSETPQPPFIPAPQFSTGQNPLTAEAADSRPSIDSGSGSPYSANPTGPAWFYAPPAAQEPPPPFTAPAPMTSVAETLQHSRERVAARWFALKGVFEQPGSEAVEPAPVRQKEIRTPVLAVLSLAGGVGKTSLVATIGRSLSSLGEKVLLTDTTSHGLLPFYFGASELRQGTVRTFSPPSGSTDAPIYLVSYEVGHEAGDADRERLAEEIVASSRGTHRILLDLSVGSAWIIRNLARMSPTVLVPLAPDMNSVISLQAIEKFFQGMVDADGRPLQPYYIINQFDVSLPLHLDVREVLRRQLGDRLLPFVIHRAPEVSEALAEGMTVVDYAPESPVSGDYMNVATWLRTVAAPATAGFRNVRWSER